MSRHFEIPVDYTRAWAGPIDFLPLNAEDRQPIVNGGRQSSSTLWRANILGRFQAVKCYQIKNNNYSKPFSVSDPGGQTLRHDLHNN